MSIEAAQLTIALEEKERWRRTLNVTVPAPLVRNERSKAVEKLAKRLRLKGFRSGQVPSSVVEKRYGAALNREVLDRVIGEAYREALKTESLQPISEGEIDNVQYEPESDLSFAISFDIRPEFELGRIGGFAITRPRIAVGDEDLERVVERLRAQNGTWRPVEEGPPEAGDLASISVLKLVDGKQEGEAQEYDLVLGQGDAIPDVEDAIRTLAPNETGDFTVTFPDDFPNEERQGEKQHLRVTVRARNVREIPELTDEFARSLGDFDDVETLRLKVREDLLREVEEQSELAVRGQLLSNLIEANPFDLPSSMIDRSVDGVLGDTEGADAEAVARAREQLRPEAERAVKRALVIDRLAEMQGLRATEEELDQRIEAIAKKNEVPPSKIYASLQKAGRLEALERELSETKVFDFLKEQSEIVVADE